MPGRTPSSPRSSSRARNKGLGQTPTTVLFRGRMRLEVIRELAMGEWSPASIAKKYGVDTSDIVEFSERYENDIAEVRSALAGQLAIETSGLWISKKQNRLAQLQADYDEIEETLELMRQGEYKPTDNDGSNMGSRRHRMLIKARMDLLRAAADELSPRNSSIPGDPTDPNVVHYVIEAGPLTEALT